MWADLDTALLEEPNLLPLEEAGIVTRDPLGDQVRDRAHPETVDHGRRVAVDVAVSVVERDHEGLARKLAAAHERAEERALGDRVVAVSLQPVHLAAEVLRADRQRLRRRRGRRRHVVDPVVHEDRDDPLTARQRVREAEPASGGGSLGGGHGGLGGSRRDRHWAGRCGALLPAERAGRESEGDGGKHGAGAEVEVVRLGSHAATVRLAANGPPTGR